MLHQQHQEAQYKRTELKSTGIITELTSLNHIQRDKEIRDTSLVYFLQNKFSSDRDNYMKWTKHKEV